MNRIVVILAAALAATGIAAAASGSSSSAATLDLALDGAHASRTLGKNGKRVGTIDATFLTTAVGTSAKHDGREQLTGTLTFDDGSALAVEGNVGAYATTSHVAVIGGTGRYAGARGQITAHFSPRAVQLHVELS